MFVRTSEISAMLIAGFVLNIAQIELPAFITRFHITDIFIYAAAGLSFFAICLRVSFRRLKTYTPLYFPLSAVKFLLTPAVALIVLCILILLRYFCCKNWFIRLKIKYQKLKCKMTNKNSKRDLQTENRVFGKIGANTT